MLPVARAALALRKRTGLRRGAIVIACIVSLFEARPAAALDLLKKAGRDLASGAVEKLEPALARTLADVDDRLSKQEQQLGKLGDNLISKASGEVGQRLGQVDGILQQRLLQVQLEADAVVDHGLDKVDGLARERIAQLGKEVSAQIKLVDKTVAKTMAEADHILATRLDQVGQVVAGSLDKADGALAARIEQLDEVAGRRLGNVDVIATKQRLGLERSLIRATWLVALVVFVVIVLRALWKEYLAGEDQIAREPAGGARARAYAVVLLPALLRHAVVGGVVAALLVVLPQHLPLAAAQDQKALASQHARELEKAIAAQDWTRMRFHASQLEMLAPDDLDRYQAMAAKADLLRDLLQRPTSLATSGAAETILRRIEQVERLQPGRVDPDVATARALLLWQRGTSKHTEREAAAWAARALWVSPQPFPLQPLARLVVRAYLHAPAPEDDPASGQLGTTRGLAAILDANGPRTELPPGAPFAALVALFDAMEELDAASSAAFVAMVAAQRGVAAMAKGPHACFEAARLSRNASAAQIVEAWHAFDGKLAQNPALAGQRQLLSVFRLNDAILSKALWFTIYPSATAWPPALPAIKDLPTRLALAPARVAWAYRFSALLRGPARELLEMQEAQRFEDYEIVTQAFADGFGSPAAFPEWPLPDGAASCALPARPPDLIERLAAARAATVLGFYEGPRDARVPLAARLTADLPGLGLSLRGMSPNAPARRHGPELPPAQGSALRDLRDLLATRGLRLL